MPIDFNDSITVFPPKGVEPGDSVDLIRDPMNTRPIALKNSDNKIICGVANNIIKHGIAKRANYIQRGFVTGRLFTENIVDLDTTSRTFSNIEPVSNIPVICTFDFAAAFPSVNHSWILRILRASGFPDGFCNLVRGLQFVQIICASRRHHCASV